MELTESLDSINSQIKDIFGVDTITGQTIFRIVWSEDQFENRLTEYTDAGILLITPEVRRLPKYRQWIHERYVLERLVILPPEAQKELCAKISYEPLWVFQGANNQYVPPTLWGAKFVIDTFYAALGKSSLKKYIDEEAEHPEEVKKARVDELVEQLYGDESDLMLRTVTGEAIAMPQEYGKIAKE